MKPAQIALAALLTAAAVFSSASSDAADYGMARPTEYAVIRWDGEKNSHVVYPDGRVEFVISLIGSAPRPDHTDTRAFIMTLLMNKLAKEGYEYAGMSSGEEIVMRRSR